MREASLGSKIWGAEMVERTISEVENGPVFGPWVAPVTSQLGKGRRGVGSFGDIRLCMGQGFQCGWEQQASVHLVL